MNIIYKYLFMLMLLLFSLIVNAKELSFEDLNKLDKSENYKECYKICQENKDKNIYAAFFIADYLYCGRKGIKKNKNEAKAIYRQVLKDLEKNSATYSGNDIYMLGIINLRVKYSKSKARDCFIKAADKGNSKAMIQAALFCGQGRGGKRDMNQAKLYIEKAIAAGNADGKALMASMLFSNKENKYEKIYNLLKESSEAGSPYGAAGLSEFYRKGIMVKKDLNKARDLIQISVDKGLYENERYLKRIKKQIEKNEEQKKTQKNKDRP